MVHWTSFTCRYLFTYSCVKDQIAFSLQQSRVTQINLLVFLHHWFILKCKNSASLATISLYRDFVITNKLKQSPLSKTHTAFSAAVLKIRNTFPSCSSFFFFCPASPPQSITCNKTPKEKRKLDWPHRIQQYYKKSIISLCLNSTFCAYERWLAV